MTTFPAVLPKGRRNPGNEQMGGSTMSFFISRSGNEESKASSNTKWSLEKRTSNSTLSSSWYSWKERAWSNRQKAQNCFDLCLKMSLEASPGSICLFLPFNSWESHRPHVGSRMEPQKNHTEIWQTGSHCDCISKKIPLLELNLRQHNNVERIYSIISALGFWNKPLVWNNCCQIACICTESYCKDLFQDWKLFATICSRLHCTMTISLESYPTSFVPIHNRTYSFIQPLAWELHKY